MAYGGAAMLFAAVALAPVRPAAAFPKFSQKEKKPCSYCHVNPGGGGKRTAAGEWYDKHGYSFAGYTPGAAAAAATPAKPATGATPGVSPAKPATPAKPAAAPKKPAAKKPPAKKPAPKKKG
jgi:hypothetical protein